MFIQIVRLLVLISVLCMLSMSFLLLIWNNLMKSCLIVHVLLYSICTSLLHYVRGPMRPCMCGAWPQLDSYGKDGIPPPPCSVPIVYDNYNGHIIWISTLSNLISSKYHYKKSKIGLLLLVRNKLVGKISSLVMAPCWKCQIVLQWLSEVS